MFARRHPFLYSLLLFSAMGCVTLVVLSVVALLAGGPASQGVTFGPRVGVVEVTGLITDPDHVVKTLARFREDDQIKAVVLRVDSPGGAIGPSQEIQREVEKTAAKKKVVVSMGSVAASGGYYVAAPAHSIMANPGTITGSIGVIMSYTNLTELMNKVGLKPVIIKAGEYKDTGSPFRELTEEERAMLRDLAENLRIQFVRAVATGRNMPVEKVDALADGRILSGEQAKDLGLVDRLGNLEDALALAGELGGMEGKPKAEFAKEKTPSLIDYVIRESASTLADIKNEIPLFAYLYSPGPPSVPE